jgi:hypothetical protein
MEGPGAWGCDTLLADGHERPAIACDRVAHHAGRTSITEQTNGRTMDAQPKQDQRLVPSHLTDAEHVITSLYECPWRSSEGQFADEDGGGPVLDFCSCAAPLRGTTPTTPISPGMRTHASRAARAVLPRSRRASSAALRPSQGEGQAGSRVGSRGGASRPLGRRGARRGSQPPAPARGLRVISVAARARRQDRPDGMELPMLAEQVPVAQRSGVEVPDAHGETVVRLSALAFGG